MQQITGQIAMIYRHKVLYGMDIDLFSSNTNSFKTTKINEKEEVNFLLRNCSIFFFWVMNAVYWTAILVQIKRTLLIPRKF